MDMLQGIYIDRIFTKLTTYNETIINKFVDREYSYLELI